MDEFSDILDDLSLVDVKTSNGWFTWSNNREGANLVKERLDRFLISEDMIENLPFITTKVVRQSKSDHKAIFLNTLGLSGNSICLDKRLVKEENVCDFFNESKDGWDKKRVLDICGENLRDQICNIPILHNGPEDRRTWFHNPHGAFSSKSAYSWLILKQISSFRSSFNDTYLRCGKDRETLIHMMKDCLTARQVLEYGGLNNKFLVRNYSRCIDWIEYVARGLDNKAVSDFITVLWNVWNSRNNRIFKGVEEGAKVTWERAAALSRDFRIFNLLEDLLLPRKAKEKVWQKLPQGVVKINFDASIHGKKACYGLIAWNSDGFVHGRQMG
ncbi:hypothetical protein Godav_024905 [Gossypium davidsonii]|uniref:Reverse transcriptase n=1 Tax=Gossypium davidsonii TaxID=34287 RepID=A0A7J8TAZ1_GOSDV|nr:hypothetical protein [Gossypium davidsonii]